MEHARVAISPPLKTAGKGAERVTVKQPKNSRNNHRNTRKTAVLTVLRVFGCSAGCFYRLSYRDPLGTLPAVSIVGHLAPL